MMFTFNAQGYTMVAFDDSGELKYSLNALKAALEDDYNPQSCGRRLTFNEVYDYLLSRGADWEWMESFQDFEEWYDKGGKDSE
jgi:hypothetical protein